MFDIYAMTITITYPREQWVNLAVVYSVYADLLDPLGAVGKVYTEFGFCMCTEPASVCGKCIKANVDIYM